MADNGYRYIVDADDLGVPVLMAVRAPGQVAAQRTSGAVANRGASSGNPQFDPVSGRFAGSGTTKKEQTPELQVIAQANRTLPQGVDEAAWNKRMDVVREIARKFVEYDNKTLMNFLKGHPNVRQIASIDVDALNRDVRAQKVDDLVDVMDSQLQSRIDVRKNVRLQSPKGWVNKTIAKFTDEEILDVAKRLEGRGYGAEVIKKQVVNKITDEARRTSLEQAYGETKPKSKK